MVAYVITKPREKLVHELEDFYEEAAKSRAAKGTDAYAFTSAVRSGKAAKKAHSLMDPYGIVIREARDGPDHPGSLPIILGQDVTGSMEPVARAIQSKLGTVMTLLIQKGYVAHPQLCAFGIGDARVQRVGSAWLDSVLAADDMTVIFEGAQGVLLDQDHGFHPCTTWSDCTFGNAERLLNEAYFTGEKERIGVVRAYATRHGAGPFPTEVPGLSFAGEHNGLGPWQGAFRSGRLDLPLLRYAVDACGGVDSVAVTCLDQLDQLKEPARVCTSYAGEAPRATRWPVLEAQARTGYHLTEAQPIYRQLGDYPAYETVSLIEEVAGPSMIRSFGPKASDKRYSEGD